jgi:hypothetical protein
VRCTSYFIRGRITQRCSDLVKKRLGFYSDLGNARPDRFYVEPKAHNWAKDTIAETQTAYQGKNLSGLVFIIRIAWGYKGKERQSSASTTKRGLSPTCKARDGGSKPSSQLALQQPGKRVEKH